jgi:hypothetical protein
LHYSAYIHAMRKALLYVPLFALLAAALWFAGRAWVYYGAGAIPAYGYFAIAGGIILSLIVGCGLMALMFYSHRYGYDEISEKDRHNDGIN